MKTSRSDGPLWSQIGGKGDPSFPTFTTFDEHFTWFELIHVFISFCYVIVSQMHGKRLVSGGGRPAEYIVNNGSNSMWAHFFQNRFEGRFRETFGSTLVSIFEVFR